MRALKAWVLALALLLAGLAPGAEALEADRRVLPSGLTVLHAERHNLPIVKVTLLVRAGSAREPARLAGLANLTARLLTDGTSNRTAEEISREIEFLGADLSASAGSDYSTVKLSVLKKDVAEGFEIFSDVVLNPTFPEEEIARNRELIKGSLRKSMEDTSFVARMEFAKALYGGHPYGRLARGSAGTLDRIGREDIEDFYFTFYRPNNAVLSVAGDLTKEELDRLIERCLSGWQRADVPGREPLPVKPPRKKELVTTDKDVEQANIVLGNLGVRRDDPDYYALSVMNYILGGGGFSSRLMESIRDQMGLAYDVHSFFTSNRDPGYFLVGVQTKNDSANTVIAEVIGQMERIREEKVSEKELEDARAYLVGSFPRRIDTLGQIANFLAAVEYFGLGLDYPDRYPEYINSVTRDDVLRVARKYLRPDAYVLSVVARLKEAGIKAP